MKEYKGKIILTSLITLFPILVGLMLWNKLPDTIVTHWGDDNQANGWSSKEMVVFGMPLLMLLFHLIAVCAIMADPKKQNISKKMMNIVIWLIPVISWVVLLIVYVMALGKSMNIGLIVNILVGVILIIIGNYLPKSRQNYTVGMKLPWALDDENNWNRTNRFSGYMFVICGIVFVINAFFLSIIPIIFVVVAGLIVPVIYSYVIYRKGKSEQ